MVKDKEKKAANGEGFVWLTAMGITTGLLMIIFMLGLFTKIGDATSLFSGLVFLYIFKVWVFLCNVGVLPLTWRPPVDNYFVGITGEVIGAIVVVIVWQFRPKKDRDLTGYTLRTAPWVWRNRKELDDEETAALGIPRPVPAPAPARRRRLFRR